MNHFLTGFMNELTKEADPRLTRVQTAAAERPKLDPSKTLWQNRLEAEAKRKRLQTQVQRSVQSRRPAPAPAATAMRPTTAPAPRPAPAPAAPAVRNERRIRSAAGALVYGG